MNFKGLFPSPQIEPGWQRNCSYNVWGRKTVGGGKRVKNFDQWIEELSKDVFTQADEDDRKVLLKTDEIFVEDDFEEEE
jgi:hypothetical protein